MMSGTTPVKEWVTQDKQRKRLDWDVVTKGPRGSQGMLCCWAALQSCPLLGLYHTLHQTSSHQVLAVSIPLSHTLPSDQEGQRETQMRGISHQCSQQLAGVPLWTHHSDHYQVQDAFQPLRSLYSS